jgi:hypothetical protein|tara:strand:- start:832 stop:1014 length:183 start_codon:yes stop_codon:yes gene_type:complete
MRSRDETQAFDNFNKCLPKITVYLEKISIALTIIALQSENQETKDELDDVFSKRKKDGKD